MVFGLLAGLGVACDGGVCVVAGLIKGVGYLDFVVALVIGLMIGVWYADF